MTSFKLLGDYTPHKLLYTAELPNVVRLVDKIELSIEDWRMMFPHKRQMLWE